jgi:preprotein translocase SecE subunit
MANPLTSIVEYFRSAKTELEKVSWPSRQETLRYGSIVIAVSVLAAGVFASIDFGLSHTISAVLAKRAGTTATAPASQPIVPDTQPLTAEGVDANGNPTEVKVTPATDDATLKVDGTAAPTPSVAPTPVK